MSKRIAPNLPDPGPARVVHFPEPGRSRPGQRLGDRLLERGLVTRDELDAVLARQKVSGNRLGTCLVEMGLLSDAALAGVLSEQHHVPYIHLDQVEPDFDPAPLVSKKTALQCQAVPFSRVGSSLMVAMLDPSNIAAVDELKFATGCELQIFVAPESQIRQAIQRFYDRPAEESLSGIYERLVSPDSEPDLLEVVDEGEPVLDLESLEAGSGEDRVVRLATLILMDAVRKKASDIHLEPGEGQVRLRFRVDGVLVHGMTIPVHMRDSLGSRLKIMARLNIAERRVPQDGRIRLRMRLREGVKDLDFRVSTLPTLHGEKIVLRLLDRDNLMPDMRRLGFEPGSLERFEAAIGKPYGLILVTGPTGSGKTNTLYSAIARLNQPNVNIMTAEDPVEFSVAGVNQVQIREQVGLTFAAALRSFLRQDPDVVLVGEMRDRETAEMAVKAALTGHLVMSTLHTNSAPAAIDRLVNMGIEPFLIASAVHLVCAQRLVRRICPACREEAPASRAALLRLGFGEDELDRVRPWRGRGCGECAGSGYKGRIGLFEVMEMSDALRERILLGKVASELRQTALAEGMITLRQSGLEKIRQGLSTMEQIGKETIG